MFRSHISLIIALLTLVSMLPARAQMDGAQTLSADQIAARVKPLHPKTLVFVFDVTQSTLHGGVFGLERAGTATILRDGCSVGDRVVLLKFGTGYETVFDKTLTENADKDALIDQIPPAVEPGRGTNIRYPHAQALNIVADDLPRPGVIILLTDSFNDRPLPTDPNYPNYLAYYTLKGLTVYPHTPENAEYEHLLSTLGASGKLHQYGVGVGIAPNGRPIERLPVGPGEGDAAAPDTAASTQTVEKTEGTERVQSNLPLLLALIGLLLLLLLAFLWWLLRRPLAIRLRLGERGMPRDFRLARGANIGLGGALTAARPGDDVFPLAGLAQPAAYVQAGRGGATLVPGPAAGVNGTAVFHSGLRLEQPVPLRVGDEIRIALPAADATPAREHRIHFEDPRA